MKRLVTLSIIVLCIIAANYCYGADKKPSQNKQKEVKTKEVQVSQIEDAATIKLLFLASILLQHERPVQECRSTIQEVKSRLLRKYNLQMDAHSFDIAVAAAAAGADALDCPKMLPIRASESLGPTGSEIEIVLNIRDSTDRFYQLVKWPNGIKLPAASFKSAGITFNCKSKSVSFSDGTMASLDKREYRFTNKAWSAVGK